MLNAGYTFGLASATNFYKTFLGVFGTTFITFQHSLVRPFVIAICKNAFYRRWVTTLDISDKLERI